MLPVLRRNGWSTGVPGEALAQARHEMDNLFDRFFGQDGGSLVAAGWSGVPIALWEDDDHFYVEAELPGVAEPDVEVTVHNGSLFIGGERRPPEGRNYLFNNRSYGRFQRVIGLPATVDANRVQAELSGGLLTLTLAKSAESKPKKIALKSK